jgi:hypothetical protein
MDTTVNGVFVGRQQGHVCLSWLIYLLSAVCAVYQNGIAVNNTNKYTEYQWWYKWNANISLFSLFFFELLIGMLA